MNRAPAKHNKPKRRQREHEGGRDKPFDRVFRVLESVLGASDAQTVSEIAEEVGFPTPTVHRLAGQLADRGLLRREVGSKRLMAGPKLINLGATIIGGAMRCDPAHSILRSLASEVEEHCQIGVVEEGEVLYVDVARAAQAGGLNIEFNAGRKGPLHCTSIGKLYLASLTDDELKGWLRETKLTSYSKDTITDRTKLFDRIREVRSKGWAWSIEEYVVGIVGCAVPILSRGGKLVAGLGLSAPRARLDYEGLQKLLPKLKTAANKIASVIG